MTRTAGIVEARLLKACPTRSMRRRLARCVPKPDFDKNAPPSFLYTSGRPNRCNPAGVDRLYFSETEATANAEYRQYWSGRVGENQPMLTFFAQVRLRRIIDLRDRRALELLGLSDTDFDGNWRFARSPTTLQRIGRAIASQQEIAALRFPSAAARKHHRSGWNLAIYPAALVRPVSVEILSDSRTPLEVIP